MAQYIDKADIVVEIERRLDDYKDEYKRSGDIYASVLREELEGILFFIDTLEEKKLDSMITPKLKFHKALPSLFDVAKHFLNLALKQHRKENKNAALHNNRTK